MWPTCTAVCSTTWVSAQPIVTVRPSRGTRHRRVRSAPPRPPRASRSKGPVAASRCPVRGRRAGDKELQLTVSIAGRAADHGADPVALGAGQMHHQSADGVRTGRRHPIERGDRQAGDGALSISACRNPRRSRTSSKYRSMRAPSARQASGCSGNTEEFDGIRSGCRRPLILA